MLFTRSKVPEEVGIPSNAVSELLDTLRDRCITMHGVMLVRNGQVAAEGYWPYFNAEAPHRMYSISKSFVSLAIGCLIDEGKLRLEDQVYAFFPDKIPENLHSYIRDTTVRDLLMMATPHSEQSYTVYDPDWIWTFFNKKPSHPPGTIFSYDTAGTVVLSNIVERLTGKTFLEYLYPRLLRPIGAHSMRCICTPEGTAWGGSGVLCRLEDMARIAYVCMHHGRWGNKQLISREYIDAATAKQIDNSHLGNEGYGYQIWRLKHDGFGFFGMGSQFAFCFPKQDFLFACTADTQSDPGQQTGVIEYAIYKLLEQLDAVSMEKNEDYSAMKKRITALSLPRLEGKSSSQTAEEINGKWYSMFENSMGISRIRFAFEESGGVMEYENERGLKRIAFAFDGYKEGVFPEIYFGEQIGTKGARGYRCLSTGAWVEERKLYVRCCIADEYFGGLQIVAAFKKKEIGLNMQKVAEWFLEDYQGFAGGVRND